MQNTTARLNRQNDSRTLLTNLESSFTVDRDMARTADIVKAIKQGLKEDGSQLDAIYNDMNELRSAYVKYKTLEEQGKQIRERIETTLGLLGPKPASPEGLNETDFLAICERAGIAGDQDLLRDELPLWGAIVHVLRHVSEIQVVNLHEVLEWLGINVTRQAIESALDTHKKLFKIKRRGREKFVSLK